MALFLPSKVLFIESLKKNHLKTLIHHPLLSYHFSLVFVCVDNISLKSSWCHVKHLYSETVLSFIDHNILFAFLKISVKHVSPLNWG